MVLTIGSHMNRKSETYSSIVDALKGEKSIGGNIIEVHLRTSPDPKYDEIIPVFLGEEKNISGYKWIESYEDADKLLDPPRLGFLVR